MKLVLFDDERPGILKSDGIVDISEVVSSADLDSGQESMQFIINNMSDLRSEISDFCTNAELKPLTDIKLMPPLPRPSKILCMGGNYREFGARDPEPMWGFLKDRDSVIGPDDTVILPEVDANIFHHEAELVVVFGQSGKSISKSDAMDYVFGYTCGVDVSARIYSGARGFSRNTDSLLISEHKSHRTFAPIGPCITTKDEIKAPHNLGVQLRVNDELRVDYNTSDTAHSIEESIEFVSNLEEINPGDVLFLGTNHQGLGAMQNDDLINIEIERVGEFSFNVFDPLRRRWDRGIDELTAKDIREGTGGPGAKVRPL
jgi:2-keto-4-pentenoate hydratase/2-oxohepta-3-ene-1,7-dioic acid hydratase in catechol pathway